MLLFKIQIKERKGKGERNLSLLKKINYFTHYSSRSVNETIIYPISIVYYRIDIIWRETRRTSLGVIRSSRTIKINSIN